MIKKMKNIIRDFKIYYQNFRELKSKVDSLAETIDDYDPKFGNNLIMHLVGNHHTKEEQIQIPGYKIFRNDGTNNRSIFIVSRGVKTHSPFQKHPPSNLGSPPFSENSRQQKFLASKLFSQKKRVTALVIC